jgi:uncharacterized ion transporter superfamily protein YfcC
MSHVDVSAPAPHHARKSLHPVLVMVVMIAAAAALTYLTPAGSFARHGDLVQPGTYHTIAKTGGLAALFAGAPSTAEHGKAAPEKATAGKTDSAKADKAPVRAASLAAIFVSVPLGLVKNAALIFMVMFVGGMFGVLRKTGAIDAAADRLIHATSGNTYILVPILMAVLALGSTFLGFISEYLVLIPLVAIVGERLGYGPIFAAATVGVAAKIGYATSVTNPLALIVAQPLAHVPIFSGLVFRLVLFIVFLIVGIAYVMLYLRSPGARAETAAAIPPVSKLTFRQSAVLLSLVPAGVLLVLGSAFWNWHENEIAAYYLALSLVFALIGGLGAGKAADAFVDGLKSMMLAALLIGLAGAVQILLEQSHVMDTLIYDATNFVSGNARAVIANELMGIEMLLGVLIPSTSGKVAVSMPILAPIAQLSGVSGQTTVLAFVLGNGLTNMITPTSGMLLAYLATARVSFTEWLRFIAPLFAVLLVLSVVALAVAVGIGY